MLEILWINVELFELGVCLIILNKRYWLIISWDDKGVVIDMVGSDIVLLLCEVKLEVILENSCVLYCDVDICSGGMLIVDVNVVEKLGVVVWVIGIDFGVVVGLMVSNLE